MTIDERLEALTMNVELISRDVESLRESIGKLAEKSDNDISRVLGVIEKLASIAESHERRLDDLEGQ